MRSIALVTAILAAGPIPSSPAGGDGPQPPNVLLIVLDDIGFEKLDWWPPQPNPPNPPFPPPGVMGYPPTPALQLLAAEGIVFTNASAVRSRTSAACRTQ
jgi:arylsulfatase A-like enzyme